MNLRPASDQPRIAVVMGTRPEAIKLAPVIRALHSHGQVRPYIVSTGQHRELLDQVVARLAVDVDVDLRLMRADQSLDELTTKVLTGVTETLAAVMPAAVVVQGDTTTALGAALAAFYARIPVAHVEAGLRSGSMDDPFPEEMNRRLISSLARWHFAPTASAAWNLEAEGIDPDHIWVTGNTSIDALAWTAASAHGTSAFSPGADTKLLVTLHRRENQGPGLTDVARAVRRLADDGAEVVLPIHPSPGVQSSLRPVLQHSSVRIVEPLDPFDLVATLADCTLVVTDSGGIQEEAPALGKPVLVVRATTERPEGVAAGAARLIGCSEHEVLRHCRELLYDPEAYRAMATAGSPYGDGRAAGRIVEQLARDIARFEERRGDAA